MEDKAENTENIQTIRIPTFLIIDEADGIQIKIFNKAELQISDSLPKNIIGIVKINGQIVPVIDMKAKKGLTPQVINDNSCVILQQHKEGKHIVKGTLHSNVTIVKEIIAKKL